MISDRLLAMRNEPSKICDYEGSTYQETFWNQGKREYEDQAEAYALKKLLPPSGNLLLEVGAGAGRNTPRYTGFKKIVLLDYSVTQLRQAQSRLGRSERYVYVAADAYNLPLRANLFDTATMIRVLHHMSDGPRVLSQIRRVTRTGGTFILEFANKRNLKAIARRFLRRQDWSPFSPEPIEFVALNFNFHPKTTLGWLLEAGFEPRTWLPVSHFRMALFKRLFPTRWLVAGDALLSPLGGLLQVSPSVFVRCVASGKTEQPEPGVSPPGDTGLFICPECGSEDLETTTDTDALLCLQCRHSWAIEDGIYIFKGA